MLMLIIAGRTGNSNTLSKPVPIRVKIHGHHPIENKTGNRTAQKLILLPNSLEELFRVAGMTNYIPHACMHASKRFSVVS